MPARSLIAGSLHRPSPAGHAIQGTNIPIINCGLGEPASLKTAGMSGVWFQGVLGRWIPFPAAFFPCGSAYVVSGGLRGPAGAFFLRRRGLAACLPDSGGWHREQRGVGLEATLLALVAIC
jgi:hypothetical protein